MATKKAETETKTTTKAVDNKMVDIFIPIDYSNPDDANFYCAVNGVGMLIPKGQTVKVPAPYAEAYKLVEQEQAIKRAKAEADRQKSLRGNQQFVNSSI